MLISSVLLPILGTVAHYTGANCAEAIFKYMDCRRARNSLLQFCLDCVDFEHTHSESRLFVDAAIVACGGMTVWLCRVTFGKPGQACDEVAGNAGDFQEACLIVSIMSSSWMFLFTIVFVLGASGLLGENLDSKEELLGII